MTCFSLADATRHLGIDAKTLHRWLVDAQLPLLCHPHDRRKKSLSDHHLQTLARLHHRSLPLLTPESPPPIPISPVLPPLPDALLALPETLATLQTQVTALRLQVCELTARLPQPMPSSSPPPTPAPKPSAATRSAPSRRPPAPNAPPKPVHVIARVEYGPDGHYVITCPTQGRLPFEPDTPEWFAWLAKQDSFRFVGNQGHFTAHHEWRVPQGAWRAHRHIRNRSCTQRLALSHELTIAVLEQAAQAIQDTLT